MISPVVLAITAGCLFASITTYSDTVVSVRDGSWHDPATWDVGTVPDASADVAISHVVSLREGLSAVVTSVAVAGHLVLESGAVLQLTGTTPDARILHVTGILECADGSFLSGTTALNARFDAGGRYIHRQGPLGFIPMATWDVESTLQVSGFVDDGYINLAHSNSWRQSFGNVEYDCPSQTVFVVDLNGHLRDIRGSLTIRSTNGKTLRLSTTQQTTINIGGNLTIEGPSHVWFTTNSGNCTVNIGGDFVYRSQGTAASYLATRGNIRFVIGGDWIIDSQSALRMASSAADSTGSRQANVSVCGDFRILRGSLVAPPPGSGRGLIEFNGGTFQRVVIGRVAAPLVGNLAYVVPEGTRVNLGESALSSEMGSLEVGGTIELGSTDGGGAIQLGSGGGNIRIPGVRTFSKEARIVYNGSAQQTLGNGHPPDPHAELDNPAGFTQAGDVTINGDLTVVRGSVSQSGYSLTVGGNVALPGNEISLQNLYLSGPNNQTINGNGATIARLEINKSAGIAALTTALSVTNMLRIGKGGVAFQSNGFLTLSSSGDDAGHTGSIGAIPPGSSIVGDVTVQRFMSGEGRLYRYVSSPVSNATVASLMDDFPVTGTFADPSTGPGIVSRSPSLYEYDESAGMLQAGWRGYPRAGLARQAPLMVGHGYAAFVRIQTATILDFTGPINQGEIHLPLGYTVHNGTANGWHLVGNPYPSAIDWDASALGKVGLSHVIAIRDNGERRFRYWDGDNQNTDIPEGRIATGQSFWVRTTSPDASLTFREAAKTDDASFYRRPVTGIPSVRITVSAGRVSDHAILKLRKQSSDSLDAWDGVKLLNDTLNVSTSAIGGGRLAIDCRPVLPDSISLLLTELIPGQYVLRISAQDSLRHLVYFVKDSYLKRTVRLNVQDSLVFAVTTDTASAQAGRFTVYIADQPSQTHEVVANGPPDADMVIRFYPSPTATELHVEGSCDEADDAVMTDRLQVSLYNAVGMRVDPQSFNVRQVMPCDRSGDEIPKRLVHFILAVGNLSPGTYLMRVAWGRRVNWIRFVKT